MPRLIDYPGRFAFIEQAAFEVVLRHGVARLSRNAIAHELGSSATTVRRAVAGDAGLAVLAIREAVRRRRGRHAWRRDSAADADDLSIAVEQIRQLVPDSPEKVGEELVWWRILLDRVPAPATVGSAEFGEEGLTLADRFRIATVGCLDQAPAPPPSPAASEVPAGPGPGSSSRPAAHDGVRAVGCETCPRSRRSRR